MTGSLRREDARLTRLLPPPTRPQNSDMRRRTLFPDEAKPCGERSDDQVRCARCRTSSDGWYRVIGSGRERRYVRGLYAATVLAVASLAVATLSACSGGTGAPRASRAGVLELRVSFRGKSSSYFGRSHEWYSPRSGVFRVEASSQGKTQVQVFDGSTWSSEYEGKVERQSGRPAMFRWLFGRGGPFARPGFGLAAVDSYLGLKRSKLLRVSAREGGHLLDVKAKLEGIAEQPVRFRVEIVHKLTLPEAKQKGVFAPPRGRLVKDLRESRPGTRPQFSEPAYWFGRQLGKARAVATLENWLGEHAPGTSGVFYTTVYRLPASVASAVSVSSHRRAYPGLGEKPPSDIWVECRPRTPGVDVPKGVGRREVAIIKTGERAALTIYGYRQGKRAGFQAVIVLRKAFCDAQGLIAPDVFRRALARFRPV